MGHGMIQLASVVVRVSRAGLMSAGVAVTSAVSIAFGARDHGPPVTATSCAFLGAYGDGPRRDPGQIPGP